MQEAKKRAQAELKAKALAEAEAKALAVAEAQAKAEAQAREQARSEVEASKGKSQEEAINEALHDSITKLRSLVYTYGNRMKFDHLSATLERMPGLLQGQNLSWQSRSYLGDMLEAVGSLMLQRNEEAKPQDLSVSLYALTQLRYLDERLLASLLRVAREKLPLFQAGDLATLIVSLAQGGLRPTRGWLDMITTASAKKLNESTPAQFIATAQSFKKLGHNPGAGWLQSYLALLEANQSYLSLLETNQTTYDPATLREAIRAAASLDAPLGEYEEYEDNSLDSTDSLARAAGKGTGDKATPPELVRHRAIESVDFDIDREEGLGGNAASAQLPGGYVLPPGAVAYPWKDTSRELLRVPVQEDQQTEMERAGWGRGQDAWARVQKAEMDAANASKIASLRASLRKRYELARDYKAQTDRRIAAATVRRDNAAVRAAPLIDQVDRLTSDYNNFKKRAIEEKQGVSNQVGADVLKKLLPIVDNFERGDQYLKPATGNEKLVKDNYQSVYTEILAFIKSLGAEEVPGEGSPFDPTFHDAIMMEPSDGTMPADTVLQVVQKGYCIGDILVRAALVKVSV
eukprot:gene10560-12213_t